MTLTDAASSVCLQSVESLKQVAARHDADEEIVATALIQALGNEDPEVAKSAFNALISIGAPALEPIQRALADVEDELKRKLERVRERIEEEIRLDALDDLRVLKEVDEGYLESTAASKLEPKPPTSELAASKLEPPTPEIPRPITDDVHFSVTAPRMLLQGTAFILDVWAHLESQREWVIKRAREAQCGRDIRIRSKGPIQVERGASMQVWLRIPDFGIEDMEDTIYWTGQVGNSTFPVVVPHDASVGCHLGTVCIFVDGLRIARLYFDLEIGSEKEEAEDMTSNEIRIKSAFASYASEDRNEVLGRIQGMLKLLPDLDIFLDVASLRSGNNWEERIREAIAQRDTFYLFWSLAASRST